MIRLALLTTDNREDRRDYSPSRPWFGTAPQALLQGFAALPESIHVDVISCARVKLPSPLQLAPNIRFHSVHVPAFAWMKLGFLGNILAVRRLLNHLQPDLVHGQGTERDCAMSAVHSGFPNVLTIHGNMRVHAKSGENQGKLYYRLAALLESHAIRRTDGVICISNYTHHQVEPLAKRTWRIPNATENAFFDVRPSPVTPRVALFVGTLDPRKNPLGFMQACADLFDSYGWQFRLCGTGDEAAPYMQQLRQFAAQHPWVHLIGWKSRVELQKEMQQASLLVLPTFEDNCPMVVLEAMAAGLPVIASNVGGIPDLITDGVTGRLFDPYCAESMKQAFNVIMKSDDQQRQFSGNAKKSCIFNHAPGTIGAKHIQVYQEILESR